MIDFCASVSRTGCQLSSLDGQPLELLPIVQANADHRSYILSTWVRSYEPAIRKLRVSGMFIPQQAYRDGESALAEAIWGRSQVITGPDSYTIHGWICGVPQKLWHVYIPPPLRGKGIARGLVETFCGKEYMVSKPWPDKPPSGHAVAYNPWLNGVTNA